MADAREVVAALPNFAAAAALGVLAAVLLRVRWKDRANRRLAGFVGLVAANYAFVGVHLLLVQATANEPRSSPFLTLAFALQALDPVALMLFAGVYPERNFLSSRAAVLPALATALLFEVALLVAPMEVTNAHDGALHPFFEGYMSVVYILVLGSFAHRHLARRAGARPRVPRGVLAGFTVLVLYRILLTLPPSRVLDLNATIGRDVSAVIDLVVFATLLVGLWLAARALAPEPSRHDLARVFLWASTAMAAMWVTLRIPVEISYALYPEGIPPQESLLFWVKTLAENSSFAARWLVFAAMIGPAFLSNQLFEIETGLRRGVVAGVTAAVLGVVGVAGALLIDGTITESGALPANTLALLVLLALVATQSVVAGRWIANRMLPPSRDKDEAYRALRRMDLYRQALHAVQEGRLPSDDLERLRERLGLSAQDARLAASIGAGRPGPLREGAVLLGRYEVVRLVGRGAHGRVFLARDRQDGEAVAIKEFPPRSFADEAPSARIEAEIAASARLDHPHVLPVRDYFVIGPNAYVVTPFMDGGSLAERLRERGPLAPREAARLGMEVADALAAAHAGGIIHRDIKPENILFDGRGRAVLGDFGVALVRTLEETNLYAHAAVPGTLAYLPPEALAGAPPHPRWDLYALGVVIAEASTGERGDAARQAMPPSRLRTAVDRLAADEPSDGYASAADAREDLRRCMDEAVAAA